MANQRPMAPFFVMAKTAGAACNLACEYCYYLDKQHLYPGVSKPFMSDDTLEKYIRQYIESCPADVVEFTWHGGEAMLRGLDFYRKAVELQKRYANGKKISNSLQTNGTLLTKDWCKFLKEEDWLVGISIDGPQRFHDEFRRTADGKPSFQNVLKAIRLLQTYGVKWNVMAVVNSYNADFPRDFYRFFKQLGCRYIQFTPIVERRINKDGSFEMEEFSVTPGQWGKFLCDLFDEWVKNDVGNIFIQIFESTLANYVGVTPGLCTLDTTCGHAAALEFNGDLYSCDHFVFPEHKLGNISDTDIGTLMASEPQQRFGMAKKETLPTQCKKCEWLFACNGECPKNRFMKSNEGEDGLNYLCEGYRRFFRHSAPFMKEMRRRILESK